MPRLPPHVESRQLADGTPRYRSRVRMDGGIAYGAWRATPGEAYEDAQAARDASRAGIRAQTLGQACDAVLEEARVKRSKGTAKWYHGHFMILKRDIGEDTRLGDITPATVEQFVRDRLKDVTGGTVNADLRALHRVFAVAIRRGRAASNPVRMVDRPRHVTPPMNWFTEEELEAVLAKVTDQQARDLFIVVAKTGMRLSELERMRPEFVRRHSISIDGKTGMRTIPLADDAMESVSRLQGPLLTHRVGAVFRYWARKLGEPRLHCHALRHTFGTSLAANGVSVHVIKDLMGHASITTTMRYVHVAGGEREQAIRKLRVLGAPTERPEAAQ